MKNSYALPKESMSSFFVPKPIFENMFTSLVRFSFAILEFVKICGNTSDSTELFYSISLNILSILIPRFFELAAFIRLDQREPLLR